MTPLDTITKCEILKCISQLFDPLGYMLPVTIRSRMLLQEVWRTRVSWDDRLSVEFVDLWEDLFLDLQECYNISIPRQLYFDPNNVSLHLFSDASNKAYGCAAYVVSEGVSSLITAKARVAPLKNLCAQTRIDCSFVICQINKFYCRNLQTHTFSTNPILD